MLKISLAFVLTCILAALVILNLASGKSRPVPGTQTNWQYVIGADGPGFKIYLDKNRYDKVQADKHSILAAGDILFSYDKPRKMDDGTHEFMAQSVVKTIMVECNAGILAPLSDLYFEEAMPTRDSKPIGGVEYPPNPAETATQVPKSSAVYTTMCPTFI